MHDIIVNDLNMSSDGGLGGNRAVYCISKNYTRASLQHSKPVYPSCRRMKRLAQKFLGCEYKEDVFENRDSSGWLFFTIEGGSSRENRTAFLATVAYHTTFEKTEGEGS